MSLQEMKAVYGKYHGVLSAMQKGVYLWGGMATVLTVYAFYRRAYLMIGAALAHMAGTYYLSRILRSRVSQVAELKEDVGEEDFNATYMKLFYSHTQRVEEAHVKIIQARAIQLDTLLKLIDQTT